MKDRNSKARALAANIETLKRLVPELKVIYTDIDGTLVGPGGCIFLTANGQYTLAATKALVAALAADIDVVPVSGRNRHQLFGDARLLGLRNYIAELGCQIIYNQGERIVNNMGSWGAFEEKPLDSLERLGVADLLFQHFAGRLEHHTPWSDGRECTYVFRGLIDVDQANNLLADNDLADLHVIDNGLIKPEEDEFKLSLPEVRAYHVLPNGCGKAAGITRDRELRGLTKSNCIGLGDALSDIDMAPAVGALCLVGDAGIYNRGWYEKIAAYDNAFVSEGKMGEGWAEAVSLFLP